jgi:DNA repair protein RadC
MSGIRDWPEDERPRERLLAHGAAALSDAELLAIFLRTGVAGKSAVDLARELLRQFGSLRALLKADLAGFTAAKGLGAAKFAQLQAVLELARRHLAEELPLRPLLDDPARVRAYLVSRLRDESREVFLGLFLDKRMALLKVEELAQGTLDAASVYPREVVKAALRHEASAVVFAHNHPSQHAEASQADRALTARLKAALGSVDVHLLDHFIVAGNRLLSFAEHGLL